MLADGVLDVALREEGGQEQDVTQGDDGDCRFDFVGQGGLMSAADANKMFCNALQPAFLSDSKGRKRKYDSVSVTSNNFMNVSSHTQALACPSWIIVSVLCSSRPNRSVVCGYTIYLDLVPTHIRSVLVCHVGCATYPPGGHARGTVSNRTCFATFSPQASGRRAFAAKFWSCVPSFWACEHVIIHPRVCKAGEALQLQTKLRSEEN